MKSQWKCNWCGNLMMLNKEDLVLAPIPDRMATGLYAPCSKLMCKNKRLRRIEPMDTAAKEIFYNRTKG